MAEEKKARIFLRRGKDADRLQTVLCQGELGYSTDGRRVFVGNGTTQGGLPLSSVHFMAAGSEATTLTAVSGVAGARAEVGDFAFVVGSDYNVQDININAASNTININDSFGTLYSLSAQDGNNLTWVAINSGIPLTHIDIPLDGLSADQVHGGDFSGNITFSGTVCAAALTATTLSTQGITASELAGTGTRAVYATSTGQLSTRNAQVADAQIITTTQYFNSQTLTAALPHVQNIGNFPAPLAGDNNWAVFDLTTPLSNASVSLPVNYPKGAIINVYYTSDTPKGDRISFAFYSSHAASGYSNSTANYNLLSRWGVGEDAGGDNDHFYWGNTFFVRLNGSNNNLVVQYTQHDRVNKSPVNGTLTIDLIGIQY